MELFNHYYDDNTTSTQQEVAQELLKYAKDTGLFTSTLAIGSIEETGKIDIVREFGRVGLNCNEDDVIEDDDNGSALIVQH